ncbi:MAG: glycosyltransferase [Candidatus Paceibacterota bacterium]
MNGEKRQKVILVLGMHRSGTSALAGILQFLGVDLGPNLMPASEFNPRGYFEDLDIVGINDKILSAIGSGWNDLNELPDNWPVRFPSVLALKEDLKKIISRDFGSSSIFAIKDPRLCLLLPLYFEIFQDLAIDSSLVRIQRAPAEVAFSLGRSEKLNLVKALQLYRKYQKYLEKYLVGRRVVTVEFNQLLNNPAQVISLIKNLVPEIPFDYQVRQKEIDAFLDYQLKHFGQQSQDDCLFSLLDNINENEQTIVLTNQTIEQDKKRLNEVLNQRERLQQENIKKDVEIATRQEQLEELKQQNLERDIFIESQHQELATIKSSLTWRMQKVVDRWISLLLSRNDGQRGRSREEIARQYLIGEGIEIGALHQPLKLDQSRARVHYVDYLDQEGLKKVYPEINSDSITTPEIIAKAEDLSPIADSSQDFVIANHLLEHVSNPVEALSEFYRVTKKEGGIVFLTLPNSRSCFDSAREITRSQHFRDDFDLNNSERKVVDLGHYLDWAINVLKIQNIDEANRIAHELSAKGYPIHFHVFSYQSAIDFINSLEINYGFGWEMIYSQEDKDEFIFILRPKTEKVEIGLTENYQPLVLPACVEPEVSIIIPVYNKFKYTYRCLKSLLEAEPGLKYEVIVADDGSTDETLRIGEYFSQIRVIRNETNLRFLKNCNKAALEAKGKYLLFLNNDTKILPGAISHLLATIKSNETIGVVGGRLILPDQTLQEAGGILWSDGTCFGYGRGDDPFKPEYSYVREIDYCSGALLLTPTELFLGLGEFDIRFAPAYYEDADYCTAVINKGYKVIYQPLASVIHYEFTSHGKSSATELQKRNGQLFRTKWQEYLNFKYPADLKNTLWARDNQNFKSRVLIIDDRLPNAKLGAGYPRARAILDILLEQKRFVTFLPTEINYEEDIDCLRELRQLSVEILCQTERNPFNAANLADLLAKREDFYDQIVISRPANMARLGDLIRGKINRAKTKIIYDAEAIFARREVSRQHLLGGGLSKKKEEEIIESEVALAKDSDRIIAVSESEKEVFQEYGVKNVSVLGQATEVKLSPNPFASRKDILFVGSVHTEGDDNPNFDSLVYFIKEVFPLIASQLDCNLHIVGLNKSEQLKKLQSARIKIVGQVDNLNDYYNNCRVFVAPTRFAAGIPLKVVNAAAAGLPSVVTPLLGEQLGWADSNECLIGSLPTEFAERVVTLYQTPKLWEKIRTNATLAISREYSLEIARRKISEIFDYKRDRDQTRAKDSALAKNAKAESSHWDKIKKAILVVRHYPYYVVKNPLLLPRFFRILFRQGLYQAWQNAYDFLQLQASNNFLATASAGRPFLPSSDYDQTVKLKESDLDLKNRAFKQIKNFSHLPKISILMPVWDISPKLLSITIESVLRQHYPLFELCIGNGSQNAKVVECLNRYAQKDNRIKVVHLENNKGISGNSNAALALATGEFVALLDYDDELSPDALFEVAKLVNRKPSADLIYSDEDKINLTGQYCYPFFKPDWSPSLLLSMNYICHLTVLRRSLINKLGGLRGKYDGTQDYDLVLRATELTNQIFHIPKVLYHWRMTLNSTAYRIDAKPQCYILAHQAIEEALERRKLRARVAKESLFPFFVRYEIAAEPLVSIIIPTRDKADLLGRCLTSIISKTSYKNYEIIIADNDSREEETKRYLRWLKDNHSQEIKVVEYHKKYNYSGINNFAAGFARGEILLFLNNDTEVINSDWLTALVEQAELPAVGAVGAKLLYANNTIQHAGVIFGTDNNVTHAFRQLPDGQQSYFYQAEVIRNYGAVTAACLAIRKNVFAELGGFDESYEVPYSDIELCLQLRKKGYLIVYTPLARLYHFESATRGLEPWYADAELFFKRWGEMITTKPDPYYNPNLSLNPEETFTWRGY